MKYIPVCQGHGPFPKGGRCPIFVIKISSKFSQIISHQRNWVQNSIFWPNRQFCQIAKCQMFFFMYNCKFYPSRIEVLQNCSAFLCASVSLVRESLRGMRENLKHKNWAREIFYSSSLEPSVADSVKKNPCSVDWWSSSLWLENFILYLLARVCVLGFL